MLNDNIMQKRKFSFIIFDFGLVISVSELKHFAFKRFLNVKKKYSEQFLRSFPSSGNVKLNLCK